MTKNNHFLQTVLLCILMSGCPVDPASETFETSSGSGIVVITTTISKNNETEILTDSQTPTTTEESSSSFSSTSSNSETEYVAECGNLILDPGEECDDVTLCTNCFKDRYFFVTSEIFSVQDFISEDPRKKCKLAAENANLTHDDSIFTALVTYNDKDIFDFPAFENAQYIFPNTFMTTIFVNKFDDIKSNDTIVNIPNINEYGKSNNIHVWTGFEGKNCSNWTSTDGFVTKVGLNTSLDTWLNDIDGFFTCDRGSFALYCIEVQNLGQDNQQF